MKISDTGIALIKEFEQCRLEAYQDSVGVWTLGWGHTAGVQEGDTCTQEEADGYFDDDLIPTENCVNGAVRVTLTQNEYDSLVCLTFNIGCGHFRTSTLLAMLNRGDDPSGQFVRWSKAGGIELAGLLRRREAERDLWLS